MADLPGCRVTATNNLLKFCGVDYLGILYFLPKSERPQGLGTAFCMYSICTRCIHMELVTSLNLNNFLLAFSRFVNMRGAVDTVYSDNGSIFHAAASVLPSLLSFTEFHNSLRKGKISWVSIPSYVPSQG